MRTVLCLLLLLLFAGPAPTRAGGVPLRIAVLGDSLSAGYGLAAADAFPARLEQALRARGCAVAVANAGVSGDTTAGGRARLDWVLAGKPQLVIVELGGNDALRGLPPQEAAANLAAILETLRQRGVKALLAGMRAPRNLGKEYYTNFDALFPRLAGHYHVPFYPFFLAGVTGRPELNQADGIHPNARGVAEIVRRILPRVVDTLGPQVCP
jgi:acyl-CoA thioesterase I